MCVCAGGAAALHRNDRCGFFGFTETSKPSVPAVADIPFGGNGGHDPVPLLLASEASS